MSFAEKWANVSCHEELIRAAPSLPAGAVVNHAWAGRVGEVSEAFMGDNQYPLGYQYDEHYERRLGCCPAVRLLAPNKVAFMSTRSLWLAALLVCGFCGCSGDVSQPGPTSEAGSGSTADTTAVPSAPRTSRGTIGVSLLTFENPFFKVIADNIEAEGKKNGYDAILLSADNDAAKQSNQVKDFIVSKVAAIVVSPRDARSIVPAIQDANAAGIPVFTVDIPCLEPNVKIVTQIATDNLGGGREAGNAIIEVLQAQGGKVAILGFATAQSCILRVKGFREVIDAHNATAATNKITIVGEYEGGGARDRSAAAMKDILQSNDGLNAVFAINDPSALGARAALEQAGKADSVVIVGFDGQPEGKQAIREGKIYADPIQFPDRMGVEVVQAIIAHSKGKEVPAETLIPTKLYKKADAEQDPSLK